MAATWKTFSHGFVGRSIREITKFCRAARYDEINVNGRIDVVGFLEILNIKGVVENVLCVPSLLLILLFWKRWQWVQRVAVHRLEWIRGENAFV